MSGSAAWHVRELQALVLKLVVRVSVKLPVPVCGRRTRRRNRSSSGTRPTWRHKSPPRRPVAVVSLRRQAHLPLAAGFAPVADRAPLGSGAASCVPTSIYR